jgi:hypothetical protein
VPLFNRIFEARWDIEQIEIDDQLWRNVRWNIPVGAIHGLHLRVYSQARFVARSFLFIANTERALRAVAYGERYAALQMLGNFLHQQDYFAFDVVGGEYLGANVLAAGMTLADVQIDANFHRTFLNGLVEFTVNGAVALCNRSGWSAN